MELHICYCPLQYLLFNSHMNCIVNIICCMSWDDKLKGRLTKWLGWISVFLDRSGSPIDCVHASAAHMKKKNSEDHCVRGTKMCC